MLLKYERITLHSRVNAWLGSALLATVGLWAGVWMWLAATGHNAIVQAFSMAVEKQTTLQE